MEKLTSRSNEKIKLAVSLRSEAKQRRRRGLFFLEGARLCEDAALCGIQIETAFFTEKASEKYEKQCGRIIDTAQTSYVITDELSILLSDTVMPQGIFCLCKILDKVKSCNKIDICGRYIALENIQSPDNLGAISRTAEALGISGLIVSSGCDIYSPKALRASMGSLLRIKTVITDDLPALLAQAANDGMSTFASTPDSSAERITDISFGFSGGCICVIGNEGAGITDETKCACKRLLTIPMSGRAESLNAATAASIIIWEMVKNNDR